MYGRTAPRTVEINRVSLQKEAVSFSRGEHFLYEIAREKNKLSDEWLYAFGRIDLFLHPCPPPSHQRKKGNCPYQPSPPTDKPRVSRKSHQKQQTRERVCICQLPQQDPCDKPTRRPDEWVSPGGHGRSGLFYGYGLGEITGLIYIAAAQHSRVIRQKL